MKRKIRGSPALQAGGWGSRDEERVIDGRILQPTAGGGEGGVSLGDINRRAGEGVGSHGAAPANPRGGRPPPWAIGRGELRPGRGSVPGFFKCGLLAAARG